MSIKRKILDGLYASRFYPHIYFFGSPFKTMEWYAMCKGVDFRSIDVGLDIGCGAGLQTALLAQKIGKVVGIDVLESVVNRAKSEQAQLDPDGKIEFRCTALEAAGFADASFDKIFSVCVLEHIPDYRSVLREAFRVLKPGGQLVFSVDSLATVRDSALLAQHKERYVVHRYFEPTSLKRDFEQIGFSDVSVTPLVKSELAARWFEDAIRREFKLRYFESWWKYHVLRMIEPFYASRTKGIYLLVRATK